MPDIVESLYQELRQDPKKRTENWQRIYELMPVFHQYRGIPIPPIEYSKDKVQ